MLRLYIDYVVILFVGMLLQWFKSLSEVIKGKTDEEKATAAGDMTAGLELLEEAFVKLSRGKSFFGGDAIGYIDIAFGSCLGWLRVLEKLSGDTFLDETKMPSLCGWAERFCSDAVVKEFMPQTDKLLEFAKMLLAALPK